jgi:hypothetical protein
MEKTISFKIDPQPKNSDSGNGGNYSTIELEGGTTYKYEALMAGDFADSERQSLVCSVQEWGPHILPGSPLESAEVKGNTIMPKKKGTLLLEAKYKPEAKGFFDKLRLKKEIKSDGYIHFCLFAKIISNSPDFYAKLSPAGWWKLYLSKVEETDKSQEEIVRDWAKVSFKELASFLDDNTIWRIKDFISGAESFEMGGTMLQWVFNYIKVNKCQIGERAFDSVRAYFDDYGKYDYDRSEDAKEFLEEAKDDPDNDERYPMRYGTLRTRYLRMLSDTAGVIYNPTLFENNEESEQVAAILDGLPEKIAKELGVPVENVLYSDKDAKKIRNKTEMTSLLLKK